MGKERAPGCLLAGVAGREIGGSAEGNAKTVRTPCAVPGSFSLCLGAVNARREEAGLA